MLPEWTTVGFSGHRKLADPQVVVAGIRAALDRLAVNHSPLAAVSSAASGSDTLFVEEVARRHLPYLLILPFANARFQNDFTPDEWQRISPLIEKATHVEQIPGGESDGSAYMEAGILTAEKADVMLVVWDGKPAAGFGGTGDVVNYARKFEKPLLIMDPVTGVVTEERMDKLPPRNQPADWKNNPRETVENHFKVLNESAEVHAPRSRHLVLRIILFQLGASAIGLIMLTFDKSLEKVIPAHDIDLLGRRIEWTSPHLWSSVAELTFLILAVAAAWQLGERRHVWMKNRIEAEICRSFLAMWDMRRRADHSLNLSIQGFTELCRDLRLIRILDQTPQLDLETTRARYLTGRVESQIAFFTHKGEAARRSYNKYKYVMWVSTNLAVFLSFAALVMLGYPKLDTLLPWVKLLSLLLPILCTAAFIMIVTQDYSRRAERYAEMVSVLQHAKKRIEEARTWNSLTRAAVDTEEELLQEVVEWHSFRRFAGEPN